MVPPFRDVLTAEIRLLPTPLMFNDFVHQNQRSMNLYTNFDLKVFIVNLILADLPTWCKITEFQS